jgi:peptidoglycan/LPS O-acetylase OafA/YrhL
VNTFKDRHWAQQEANVALYSSWLPGWRGRRTRRRVAAVWLVSAVALCGLSLAAATGSTYPLFAWLLLLLITTALQMLNKVLTSNISERTARLLDERELALRGRCGYVGFLVATWSMVAAAVIFAVTPIGRLPVGPYVLLMSLVMLASSTPSALLAWQLPDDEPDPIAEGEHRG